MKAKFKAGDTVKIIKIYNTPVPERLKNDPLIGLLSPINPRHITEGDEFVIRDVLEPRDRSDGKTLPVYSYNDVNGKKTGFILWEDEIELVSAHKPEPAKTYETATLKITVDLSDKAEAYRIANTAVDIAFKAAQKQEQEEKPKINPWTELEIRQAQNLVADMSWDVTYNGGDVTFSKNDRNSTIKCSVYPDSFDIFNHKSGYSRPFEHDAYNVWIGKCVALHKALGKPVPAFIRNKNTQKEIIRA